MSDLLWPGDARAGTLCSDESILSAMVRVESAWLHALRETTPEAPAAEPAAEAGSGPAADLAGLVSAADLPALARDAERGGNPVIPLLALLRERLPDGPAKQWLHRGLTSQDVLDTALVLVLREAAERIRDELAAQADVLSALADRHRATPMAGRTLTQHAVPMTFGLKAATWLHGLLDARDTLSAASLPIQIGGAAGSLAAPEALARALSTAPARRNDPASPDRAEPRTSLDLVTATAELLGLPPGNPWHTARAPFTRFGDALVTCTDAWSRAANDVLTLSRPEIGELSEATGGGSSTMPNKSNPVLSVLIRRAALAGPPLAATLHAAAADQSDERAAGAWHVEWPTIRLLTRRTAVAASQTTELLTGLRVHVDRMAANLATARPGIDAEQRSMHAGGDYRGATDRIIDTALARAAEKPC